MESYQIADGELPDSRWGATRQQMGSYQTADGELPDSRWGATRQQMGSYQTADGELPDSRWGATRQQMQSLSAFHRKQLRELLGIRWPNTIRNVSLYTRTGTSDIADTIHRSPPRLFGHCLRVERSTPAQLAMDGYYSHRSKGRIRRLRTALPSVLAANMVTVGLRLKSSADLDALHTLAADRAAHGGAPLLRR